VQVVEFEIEVKPPQKVGGKRQAAIHEADDHRPDIPQLKRHLHGHTIYRDIDGLGVEHATSTWREQIAHWPPLEGCSGSGAGTEATCTVWVGKANSAPGAPTMAEIRNIPSSLILWNSVQTVVLVKV